MVIDDASLDCTGPETDWPRLVDASNMIIPIRETFSPKTSRHYESKEEGKKRALPSKNNAGRSKPTPVPTSSPGSVTFRLLNGTKYAVTPPSKLPAMAMYWEY